MSRFLKVTRYALFVALALRIGAPTDAWAQFKNWIGQAREVTLTRKRPPSVYLMQTEIAVRVTAQTPAAQPLSGRLASALQAEILQFDTRLKPSPSPGTIISCAIGRVETSNRWENRKVTVTEKTGTKQEWNDKKKQYETKDVYGQVERTQRVQIVSGGMNVSYQTADKSGAVLDADTIDGAFNAEYVDGNGAPTDGAIQEAMLHQVVARIVPRITPTTETLKVMLGRGDVDKHNKWAESGMWNKWLQELELMTPLKDPKKEAYRQFNIGVANEALAYQAEEMAASKKLLEQASIQYVKALELKPDEQYFRSPQQRIATSIAAYQKLEQQQSQYASVVAAAEEAAKAEAAKAAEAKAAEGARDIEAKKAEPKPLGNADIIDLVKSGLDKENLIATIKGAPEVAFDLSPAGLKGLLANGVSNQLITVMRARQTAQDTGAAKKPAAPAKKTSPPVKKQG